MSVTGTAESGPTRVGIAICDLLGGIFSAQGILLALEARHRTGRGQRVETSLLESIVSILSWSAGIYFDTGRTPGPAGNHHPLSSPHGVFKAADRVFNIAVGNEAMWRKFVGIIGRPELANDDRFTGTGHRLKYRDALTAESTRRSPRIRRSTGSICSTAKEFRPDPSSPSRRCSSIRRPLRAR